MTAAATQTRPVTVLVVDDSEDQRLLLRRYFERAGCIVATASTAEEAIESYRETAPHLAVVDLVLPGIDGWELTARLRADLPTVAIAITSVLDATDYPTADAILPKPVTGEAVRQVLRDCVPGWVQP